MRISRITVVAIVVCAVACQLTLGRSGVLIETKTFEPVEIVPACAREDLSIKEGETDAAMGGVRRTPFVITNTSKAPCTLTGYPSLELLKKTGAVVKRATQQKVDDPIAAATLKPGKTAWFALNFNAGGAGNMGPPCPTYRQVRITVPGVKRPFVVRSEIQSCGRSQFEVTPIQSGSPE
jgi:hypothetical protein